MSDDFDFDGTQSQPHGSPMQIWDMLSILVLVITVCLADISCLIFINPNLSFNILPPGRDPADPVPTLTVTPIQLRAHLDSQSHPCADTQQYAASHLHALLYQYTLLARPAHQDAKADHRNRDAQGAIQRHRPSRWKAPSFILTWPATGQASAGRWWMPTAVPSSGWWSCCAAH